MRERGKTVLSFFRPPLNLLGGPLKYSRDPVTYQAIKKLLKDDEASSLEFVKLSI